MGLRALAVVFLALELGAPIAEAAPRPARFIAQDVIALDRIYRARQQRVETLLANAVARDANGEAEDAYRFALRARDRCGSRACLDAWYARQEAALRRWEGADEILAQPLR